MTPVTPIRPNAAGSALLPADPPLPSQCDVLVVGGGINGAGIARDLAGRGLEVVLVEREDLAQHTSSASTKLIHGGLRYLEYYEFSLVRKALAEREGLLRGAPHIMRPVRIVMPHDPSMRPAWMLRAGLFLYDHLARRELLPASAGVDLRHDPAGAPLKPHYRRGFVYSDGWVDDARLVVLCALDAQQHGATVLTRCACVDARRGDTHWQATLRHDDGREQRLQARALVNAAGPWAAQFLDQHAHQRDVRALRLVKGSHIVVPRCYAHDQAYLFQNPDKRIIFVQPYEDDYTLIGTTDIEHMGPIGAARIDDAEVLYLCEQASRYFERPVRPVDVVWAYSGVRPLLDDESVDASAVTRDYLLELDARANGHAQPVAPLLNVWGGKITTFRLLAEEAADQLAPMLGAPGGRWTRGATLPGGDLSAWIGPPMRPDADLPRFVQALQERYPAIEPAVLRRWARLYGGRVERVLAEGRPGTLVAPGVYDAELRYLVREEWARSADDILWRRTKLGLHLDTDGRHAVEQWCASHLPGANPHARADAPLEKSWS